MFNDTSGGGSERGDSVDDVGIMEMLLEKLENGLFIVHIMVEYTRLKALKFNMLVLLHLFTKFYIQSNALF